MRPGPIRGIAVAVATVVLAATSAACTPARVATTGPAIVDLGRDGGAGITPIDPTRGTVLPAAQLRLLLEELLGVHGTLTVQMMRVASAGGAALPAWIDALAGNTAELSGVIGLAYGPDAARAFDQLWSFHTQFFLSYADAVRVGDEGAADEALDGLADYQADFASFIATATGGAAPAEAVATMLGTHVEQLVGQLDAFERGDLATSLEREREGHEYLASIGSTLAGAISAQDPTAFPGSTDGPATAFCSIAASKMTTLSDSVVATVTTATLRDGKLPSAWEQALTAPRAAAVAAVGSALGADASKITDVFSEDQTSALASVLLAAVEAPTPELTADAHDLATLGPRLLADLGNTESAPAAIRDAYATAYRLAAASHPG